MWFRDSPLSALCPASRFDHLDMSFNIRDGMLCESHLYDFFALHVMPDGFVEEIISTPILNG